MGKNSKRKIWENSGKYNQILFGYIFLIILKIDLNLSSNLSRVNKPHESNNLRR